MSNRNNATCSICGEKYHVCRSCLEQKTFKPWRTVTDSIDHYKIYLAIHGYTVTKNREKAKEELEKCDLSEMDNFYPEIKSVINEIMAEPKKKKTFSKSEKGKVEINTSTEDIETINE